MTVEENKKNDEAEIQRLLDDGTRSIRDKNIEGVMSLYAQEVVSFDIVPPLRYMGADTFRKRWEEDRSLAALDRLLAEGQRHVADCAPSELGACRFGEWQSGALPQAIAMVICQ